MENDLQIIPPDRGQHRRELFELIAKAFPRRGYWTRLRYCEDGYIEGSTYDWNASRIGIVDGRIVTHFGIWDYRLRIGEAAVRFAGVGAVATDGEYLKRGLMSRTIRACLEDLPAAGYAASLLFGIENFYHRFGYVPAWPGQHWTVEVGDLPTVPPAFLIEEIRGGWTELSDLYNHQNRGRTGTAVRPTYGGNRWPDRWSGYRWDRNGAPAGFLVIGDEGDALEVIDAAGDTAEILAALGHLARARCKHRAVFAGIPFDGDLARTLRRGNADLRLSYRRSGGAMGRIENLERLLREMLPEISARLSGSPFRDRDITLRFVLRREQNREESVLLRLRNGEAQIPEAADGIRATGEIRGDQSVFRLILGSDEPDETIREADIRLEGDAEALAPLLFPARHPVLASWDRF